MQNDFMNAFNSLVTDLEQQLNELQATTTKQSEQIERLTAVNRNLIEQNEIKQREQATGEHQRTAERFTHQVIREIQNEINPQQSKGMKR